MFNDIFFIFTCRYGFLQYEYSRLCVCVCVCVCVYVYLYIHNFFLASDVASMGPCTGSVSGSVTSYLGIRRSIYSFTILWGAAYSISSLVDTWVRAAESSRTASYCFTGIFAIWRFILQGLHQVKWKRCWNLELLLDRGESKIVCDCFVIVSWRHPSVFQTFRINLCDCNVKLLCSFWIFCALRISWTFQFLRYMLHSNDFWADHDCRWNRLWCVIALDMAIVCMSVE